MVFKFEFPQDGTYNIKIGVEGILFTPIAEETVSFDIVVGEASAQPINAYEEERRWLSNCNCSLWF